MKPKTIGQRSPYKAFTLLEVLCLMLIMGIALSLLVPSLLTAQNRHLEKLCLDQVLGDMRFVQNQAIRSGYSSYILMNSTKPNEYYLNYLTLDKQKVVETKTLPRPMTLRTNPGKEKFVAYTSQGNCQPFYTIHLCRKGKSRWEVIPYETGQVRVEEVS